MGAGRSVARLCEGRMIDSSGTVERPNERVFYHYYWLDWFSLGNSVIHPSFPVQLESMCDCFWCVAASYNGRKRKWFGAAFWAHFTNEPHNRAGNGHQCLICGSVCRGSLAV